MAGYLLKRLISGVVAFLIFTAIIFFGINLLIPNDYVVTLSLQITGNEARDALREELGLNLPVTEQYVNWLQQLARGDLGQQFSIEGRGYDVSSLIASALPATLFVFVTGGLLAFAIGRWLGQATAWRTSRWLSGSLVFGAIATYTAFPPWLAFLLGFIVIDRLDLLPERYGFGRLDGTLWSGAPWTPEQIMARMLLVLLVTLIAVALLNRLIRGRIGRGLPLLLSIALVSLANYAIWTLGDYQSYALDLLRLAAIPLLTFTLLSIGDTMLIMRASMQDVKHEAYIETARAKGVTEALIKSKHAQPNAILPVLSQFVISIPYLLTAIVIVERATGWAGIGEMLFNAIDDQNTYVYMGILVIVALVSMVARIFLDVAYAYLDPRIRFGPGSRRSTA